MAVKNFPKQISLPDTQELIQIGILGLNVYHHLAALYSTRMSEKNFDLLTIPESQRSSSKESICNLEFEQILSLRLSTSEINILNVFQGVRGQVLFFFKKARRTLSCRS
jgi:hypothetical protein